MRVHLATAFAALTMLAVPASAGTNPFAETAKGLRPALDHLCTAQGAAEDPAFIARMSTRYGFKAENDTFTRTGDDGSLEVMLIYEGCTFRLEGQAAMVAEADRVLQAFSRRKGLTKDVSDQSVSGEEGRRISRERFTPGRGRLNWQVFNDYNGRDKPSSLEGVWNRHPH